MATERQTFLSGDVHELVVSACPGALYIHGRFLAVDLSLKWKELELLFKAGKVTFVILNNYKKLAQLAIASAGNT